MGKIKFRMAARCEAAGRPNNEDNFQLSDDVSGNGWEFTTDKEIVLGKKGALMVVADGMGGMNAGEVASALAVDTIKEFFSSELQAATDLRSHDSVKKFVEKAIIAADARIKSESRQDKSKEGMGSTIVLAWMIGDSVYVGWCGDSRAYCFNPADGLQRLSRDHSYVQELVDSGRLMPEYAFDHPESNIITRSLGDPRQKARPEVAVFPLRNSDIIMLCSDGLSGVLRDEDIAGIIGSHAGSMEECRDALWSAARDAGWHDNVTVGLCQILSGGGSAAISGTGGEGVPQAGIRKLNPVKAIVAVAIVLAIGLVAGLYIGRGGRPADDQAPVQADSPYVDVAGKALPDDGTDTKAGKPGQDSAGREQAGGGTGDAAHSGIKGGPEKPGKDKRKGGSEEEGKGGAAAGKGGNTRQPGGLTPSLPTTEGTTDPQVKKPAEDAPPAAEPVEQAKQAEPKTPSPIVVGGKSYKVSETNGIRFIEYKAVAEDTLFSIAQKFNEATGATENDILKYNTGIPAEKNTIKTGSVYLIPILKK